jgi:hypothetical protein
LDRAWGFFAVAALLLSSAIIGLFSVNDLFGSSDFAVRLRAGLMALAALYVALGGVVLAFHLVARGGRGGAAAGAIILSSSLLTAGFGLLLGLYQVTVGDLTPWLAVWVGMVVAGVVIAIFIARRGARLPYPRQVAVVASITTLVAVGNFAYTSFLCAQRSTGAVRRAGGHG